MKQTQTQLIQKHLEDGKSISALEALNLFGCLRLASRIYDIKQLGLNIQKEMITKNGASFSSYSLVS